MERFKSRFADDLEGMISLKVATNFSESTYLERAKTFDFFVKDSFRKAACLQKQLFWHG